MRETAVLRPKQQRAVLALLRERTVSEAAAAAGVGERTLYKWLKLPEFKAALADASRALFADAIDKLRAEAPEAVETIRELRVSAQTDSVRLRAALAVFDVIAKADLEEMTRRLEALEDATRQASESN